MQRTVYNVWGREVKNREEANARAAKALTDNPKIQNLHIAILPYFHFYSYLQRSEIRYRYQARWYDRGVARKEAAKQRERDRVKEEPHACNCVFCEYNNGD